MKTRHLLILFIAIVAMALAGCSRQHARAYSGAQEYAPTNPDRVEVLYSFPEREHDRIGAINVRHYRPGWGEPTVEDARGRIQRTAAEIGAHAVVIQNTQATADRQIHITGEAIRWVE